MTATNDTAHEEAEPRRRFRNGITRVLGTFCVANFPARYPFLCVTQLSTAVETPGVDARITLRKATPADAPRLVQWDGQPHVIACDPNDDWHWETELANAPDWREQLVAELDGRPIGCIQIIDPAREEFRYWGDVPANLRAIDIWIGEAEDLGKGYGTTMMHLALARCSADPAVTAVLIDPLETNRRAHVFYERMGFLFVEKRTFDRDCCCVYCLDRHRWKVPGA